MPIIQLCDECHAKVGTCSCYDWPKSLTKVYRLEETVSVPGGNDKKTLKSFTTEDKAIHWLKEQGYKHVKHMNSWEKAADQEAMFDVWVYVKIKAEEVES